MVKITTEKGGNRDKCIETIVVEKTEKWEKLYLTFTTFIEIFVDAGVVTRATIPAGIVTKSSSRGLRFPRPSFSTFLQFWLSFVHHGLQYVTLKLKKLV